jgi:hypothetical protein
MPQIIVAADRGAAFGEGAVMLRERVTVADFESQHFAAQLVERLGWAVEDADHAEQIPDATDEANRRGQEQLPEAASDIAEDRESHREKRLTARSPA